jgi:hypothetical protein
MWEYFYPFTIHVGGYPLERRYSRDARGREAIFGKN